MLSIDNTIKKLSDLINEIKMKYPKIDETIKEAVIQKLNDGAEKFQDQIRNYMIKK